MDRRRQRYICGEARRRSRGCFLGPSCGLPTIVRAGQNSPISAQIPETVVTYHASKSRRRMRHLGSQVSRKSLEQEEVVTTGSHPSKLDSLKVARYDETTRLCWTQLAGISQVRSLKPG